MSILNKAICLPENGNLQDDNVILGCDHVSDESEALIQQPQKGWLIPNSRFKMIRYPEVLSLQEDGSSPAQAEGKDDTQPLRFVIQSMRTPGRAR